MKRTILLALATCSFGLGATAQIQKIVPGSPTKQSQLTLPATPPIAPVGGSSFLLVGTGTDDCTTPDVLGAGPGTFMVDNTTATTGVIGQTEAACNFFASTALYNDVWFTWTATATGTARITMCGGVTAVGTGTLDTRVAVYDGNTCPGAAAIACNDDSCGLVSKVSFPCVNGQAYLFQFGAYAAASARYSGSFTVDYPPPPTPDDCSIAQVISGPGPHSVDNSAATTGTQGQSEAICLSVGATAIYNDVWFTWTAACTGPTVMSLCAGGATVDTKMAVYPGAGCPTAAAIACNDDSCGLVSQLTFNAVGGQQYSLQFGAYGAGTARYSGTFTMTTTCTEAGVGYCTGDNLDPNLTQSCPCANYGTAGNGCASSFNASGAHIASHGSVASDNVVLDGSGMNLTSGNCIFLKGNSSTPTGLIFGDGVRCTDGVLIRLRTVPLVTGAASFPDSTQTITLSARGGTPVGSALTASYTVYYRNAAAGFCPPATFNSANGYLITW